MNEADAPFFLSVKHQRKTTDTVWYKKCPLGKNGIRKLLSTATKNVGLPGKVTNHSVRKTCIWRLLELDVPKNYHRNLKSLDSYKTASIQHQRWMSLTLSRSSAATGTQPTGNHAVRSNDVLREAESAIFSSAKFNNCSFSIQVVNGPVNQATPTDQPIRKYHRIIESDDQDN